MTQLEKLPDQLLDSEGYPTDEWLEFLRQYTPDDSLPIMDFVQNVLIDGWWMPAWGFKLKRKYKGVRKLELHTGGWSGNEEIINVLVRNFYLTQFAMKYVKWTTGGHYYFKIKEKK
jgi:hypothetical protein